MFNLQRMMIPLTLVLFAASASAGNLVYVITSAQQFGTVELSTGAFQPIGPIVPEGSIGLVPVSNGLLTLTFSGNLDLINPATGVTTVIGATGLGDCTTPASPCGPNAANALGGLGGVVYATDFANNLYSVNQSTGAASLIGPTGIPAIPSAPGSLNPDGSMNLSDEDLFSAGGKLYATFDVFTLDLNTFVETPVIAANLYTIDPSTGLATLVAPTDLSLNGLVAGNDGFYGFSNQFGQVLTVDLSNGNTSFVTNVDPAAGIICGAASTPEPGSIGLAIAGIAAILIGRRRRPGAPR